MTAELPRDTRIARYMTLAKFVSMLATSSLHFTSVPRFEDDHEGTLSPEAPPKDDTDKHLRRALNGDYLKRADSFYANCWHVAETESVALWQLYAPSNNGVSIVTTVGQLHDSTPGIHVSPVTYSDTIEPGQGGYHGPFLRKRRCFEHEKEVRAWFEEFTLTERTRSRRFVEGVSKKVELGTLIDCVSVSPGSESYFLAAVQEVCSRFGLDIEVLSSAVDSPPSTDYAPLARKLKEMYDRHFTATTSSASTVQ